METNKIGHTYVQWTAALLANCITLCYGFESGWISPITKYLNSDKSPTGAPVSDYTISWIACSMGMTATIGVPLNSYIADVYGSKVGVIFLTIPQALAWLIKISFPSTTGLIIARIVSGIVAGGIFNVIPMYVKEISQDNIRGILGSLLVLMQNIGIFVMYLMGAYMNYYTVLYICLVIPVAVGLLLLKAPESPAFLVRRGKMKRAAKAIALLRGLEEDHELVKSELQYLKDEEDRFKALPDISIAAIVKEPAWRRGLIITMFMITFHGMSGTFIIVIYASAILTSTGVKFEISPEVQTLSLPVMMIIASVSLTLIVERIGRKTLLSGGFVLTFISMVTLGAAILVQKSGGTVPGWLPIVAMMLSVSMYAGVICPLPYIIMTEMFSYQIRAKVMGAIVTYVWFASFVEIALYTPLSANYGHHSAFFVFGGINLLGAIFVLIFLPETKGRNDEEVRKMLCNGVSSNRMERKIRTYFFK